MNTNLKPPVIKRATLLLLHYCARLVQQVGRAVLCAPGMGWRRAEDCAPCLRDTQRFGGEMACSGHARRMAGGGANLAAHGRFATPVCLALTLALTAPASAVERHTLQGHVPEAVARFELQPLGRLPATNRLNLAIGLPLRNTNELTCLLQDVYEPASPRFRHYLTSDQFSERFGPTKEEYEAVRRFAEAHGLEIVRQHGNRVVLSVAGQVSDIEKAFHVRLRTYQHPKEARQF